MPFRETHHISGSAVKMAEEKSCQLSDLTVADLQTIHPLFADDVALVSTTAHFLLILKFGLAAFCGVDSNRGQIMGE